MGGIERGLRAGKSLITNVIKSLPSLHTVNPTDNNNNVGHLERCMIDNLAKLGSCCLQFVDIRGVDKNIDTIDIKLVLSIIV
jgi:hypothetical protein